MALGNETIPSLDNVLKTQFEKKINIMTYAEDIFAGTVNKKQDFTGKNLRQSLRYGSPQGGSIDFTKAVANKTSSNDAGFLLTRAHDYYTGGIDSEAIVDDDSGTILDTMKSSMDGCQRMIRRSLEIGLYGNGGGARGKLVSGTVAGTGPFTLGDITQIVNFEKDMTIALSITDGTSGSVKTGTAVIARVDRDAGAFYTVANLTAGIATAANTDYVFRDGDFGAHIKGLAAWLPLVAPAPGDNFFGQDRSFDTVRLGGIRYVGGGAAYEQTLIKCMARVKREGGSPDIIIMNNDEVAQLALSLGSRVQDAVVKDNTGQFGFDALKIVGVGLGAIKVAGSINVPTGRAYMLQMDTWAWRTKGQAPTLVNDDGLRVVRDPSGDGVLWRLRYYGQLGCNAPGWNAVITW